MYQPHPVGPRQEPLHVRPLPPVPAPAGSPGSLAEAMLPGPKAQGGTDRLLQEMEAPMAPCSLPFYK